MNTDLQLHCFNNQGNVMIQHQLKKASGKADGYLAFMHILPYIWKANKNIIFLKKNTIIVNFLKMCINRALNVQLM